MNVIHFLQKKADAPDTKGHPLCRIHVLLDSCLDEVQLEFLHGFCQ